MLWGTGGDRVSKFQAIMAALPNQPTHVMAFNEPDLGSQANISPQAAAAGFKQYLQPLAAKGIRVGSPAIAYSTDWLQSFFTACNGCDISFIAIHWSVTFRNFLSRI